MIELMMVIAIAGILATFALPSFKSMLLNQRIKTATEELFMSISYARSEATMRGLSDAISIVPNDTSATKDWALGWSVAGATTGTLKTFPAKKNIQITGPNVALTYRMDGRLTAAAPAQPVFTITAAGGAEIATKCVIVRPSGQPLVRTGGGCP